jgi:hypothetical protein
MFVRGCLFDLLRFLLVVLGMLCAALWLVGFWLGPEHTSTFAIPMSPSTAFNITLRGPSPDLHVVIWEQNEVLHTSKWLGGITLPVLPIALSTIGLCLLMLAVERYDPRRHWRD